MPKEWTEGLSEGARARPPENIERLPKWAQRRIEKLERDLDHWKARAAEGPENSRAFADPYSDAPRPLGANPHVEFLLGPSNAEKIRVMLDDDRGVPFLVVHSNSNSVSIEPRSSNSVNVFLGRW